jgi:hypothetical protein
VIPAVTASTAAQCPGITWSSSRSPTVFSRFPDSPTSGVAFLLAAHQHLMIECYRRLSDCRRDMPVRPAVAASTAAHTCLRCPFTGASTQLSVCEVTLKFFRWCTFGCDFFPFSSEYLASTHRCLVQLVATRHTLMYVKRSSTHILCRAPIWDWRERTT